MFTEENVGRSLRDLRLMRGVSQKELAARVGIKPAQVSQMETGKYHPSLVMLTRILDALEARLAIELAEGGRVDAHYGFLLTPGSPGVQ